MNKDNKYSIVIPIYNEEENIPELYRRLTDVMTSVEEPYEIIFVNDGSQDGSKEILSSISRKDKRVKILSLSRNFGQQAAITAGIDHAEGDAIILMDGDLQDPPEILPQLISKWKEGWEVVYATKKKRKENILRRMAFAFFYRILNCISSIKQPLNAGTFSLIDRKIVTILRTMPERNRYISGLRAWTGYKQTGIEYERPVRHGG